MFELELAIVANGVGKYPEGWKKAEETGSATQADAAATDASLVKAEEADGKNVEETEAVAEAEQLANEAKASGFLLICWGSLTATVPLFPLLLPFSAKG